MKAEGTKVFLLTISALWSSSRWPKATLTSSRRQSISLGGRYRQVSLYLYCHIDIIQFQTVAKRMCFIRQAYRDACRLHRTFYCSNHHCKCDFCKVIRSKSLQPTIYVSTKNNFDHNVFTSIVQWHNNVSRGSRGIKGLRTRWKSIASKWNWVELNTVFRNKNCLPLGSPSTLSGLASISGPFPVIENPRYERYLQNGILVLSQAPHVFRHIANHHWSE